MKRLLAAALVSVTLGSFAAAHPAPSPNASHAIRVEAVASTVTDAAQSNAGVAQSNVGAAQSNAAAAQSNAGEPVTPAIVVDRDSVRAALAAARAKNAAAFHAYAAAGIYPSNVTSPSLLNVWRDQDGHYCAAATVMFSTNPSLAARIGDSNNNLRLATVDGGDVMSWILSTGFTQEELVMIQKPFMPVVEKPVPQPVAHVDIDARLRAAETRRLRKLYAGIETQLRAQQAKSLDLATDRLLAHPALAAHVVAAAHVVTARS